MASVVAFGRVGGVASYQYGPRKFSKDWGGVFTALAIMDILERVTTSSTNILHAVADVAGNVYTDPPSSGDVAEYAQQLKSEMLLASLEFAVLDIEHIQVTTETLNLFKGNAIKSKFFRFEATVGVRPARFVADGLVEMSLNSWGYLNQITLALCRFNDQPKNGSHRCMSVFFTM
jgi:hypothetical protein